MIKILIIQPAFIGDSILSLSMINDCKKRWPNSQVDYLIRKGNESIARNNPDINKLWIWDKKGSRYLNLFKLIGEIKKTKYDFIFNTHKHMSSGLVTTFVDATFKIGYKQNPFSIFFTHKLNHKIPHMENGRAWHEVERTQQLINIIDPKPTHIIKPTLHFTQKEMDYVNQYIKEPFIVMSPASVWFTKQWPEHKWQELVRSLHQKYKIYLLGAPNEKDFCERIRQNLENVENLCGKMPLNETGYLMKFAVRSIVNDSSALHLASAVDGKTTAIFNSTAPEYGFYPLSTDSVVVETRPDCKPCGFHGHMSCPKGHYKCAEDISVASVVATIN